MGLCSYRLRPCQRDLPGVHRLRRLNLDYVDLVYPQQPVGDIKAAWRNLETAVRQGKVRTLGLSNFEDLTVCVEIREKAAYVHGPSLEGAGGLPVGTGGKAAL